MLDPIIHYIIKNMLCTRFLKKNKKSGLIPEKDKKGAQSG